MGELRRAYPCVTAIAMLSTALPASGQSWLETRSSFLQWATASALPMSQSGLHGSSEDLIPIVDLIGSAKIVGLTEGQHGAAEPLIFRNRLFKHLVEHASFRAIAIESGVIEGRVLNDYVVHGKGEFETAIREGFSYGFDTFQQNRDLIRWMRSFNAGKSSDADKIQIYGIDVPGSPGNFDAVRRPDTALASALEYLASVDPEAAKQMRSRMQRYLPVLHSVNRYGELKAQERDELTAAVSDLVSLMEREKWVYLGKSSRENLDWAQRSAIGARQIDNWFRQMPLGWKLEDGLAWTRTGLQVRDRSMADNLEWVMSRLGRDSRVLVFAATGHLASTKVLTPSAPFVESEPAGLDLRERYGSGFINILNIVAEGEIKYCSSTPPRMMTLKSPPESSATALFTALPLPRYVLDLRRAPSEVSSWLRHVQDHWNGFIESQFETIPAFDLVYVVHPISSACVEP